MEYLANGTIEVRPMTLDMHSHYQKEMPAGWFVKHEPGDFATVKMGPVSFYLSREQLAALLRLSAKLSAEWQAKVEADDSADSVRRSVDGSAVSTAASLNATV